MLADVGDLTAAMDELGLPLVVKIPDGSFSRGVHKVHTPRNSAASPTSCSRRPTFCWRRNSCRPNSTGGWAYSPASRLFVCQYRMARGHWQIVKHRADGSVARGRLPHLRARPGAARADRHRGARGAADRRGLLRRRHQGDRPRLHRHGGQRQSQPRARHRGPGRQGRDLDHGCSSGSSTGSSSSC